MHHPPSVSENEKLYYFAYLGYLRTKEEFPDLNHQGQDPEEGLFDLAPEVATAIRLTVCRELDRH